MPVYFKNIIATVLLVSAICPQVAAEPYGAAVLQALDKVTARVSTFEAPVGELGQIWHPPYYRPGLR